MKLWSKVPQSRSVQARRLVHHQSNPGWGQLPVEVRQGKQRLLHQLGQGHWILGVRHSWKQQLLMQSAPHAGLITLQLPVLTPPCHSLEIHLRQKQFLLWHISRLAKQQCLMRLTEIRQGQTQLHLSHAQMPTLSLTATWCQEMYCKANRKPVALMLHPWMLVLSGYTLKTQHHWMIPQQLPPHVLRQLPSWLPMTNQDQMSHSVRSREHSNSRVKSRQLASCSRALLRGVDQTPRGLLMIHT